MADADPVRIRVLDLLRGRPAVEQPPVLVLGRRRGCVVVPEPVPLGRLLRVKVVLIVECNRLRDPFDAVFKRFATEP